MAELTVSAWHWDPNRNSYYVWNEQETCWVYQDGSRVYSSATGSGQQQRRSSGGLASIATSSYQEQTLGHNKACGDGDEYSMSSLVSLPCLSSPRSFCCENSAYESSSATIVSTNSEYNGRWNIEGPHWDGGSHLHTPESRLLGGNEAHEKTIFDRGPGHFAKQKLDPDYKVRKDGRKFFQVGKVFRVLWPESGGGENIAKVTVNHGRGEIEIYTKIRWFVVVKGGEDGCTRRPIATYGSKRAVNPVVSKRHHAIIYTGKSPPCGDDYDEQKTRAGDVKRSYLPPIRVSPKTERHKMDSASRLDYATMYTVEHNVKGHDFGEYQDEKARHSNGASTHTYSTEDTEATLIHEYPGKDWALIGALEAHITDACVEKEILSKDASCEETKENDGTLYPLKERTQKKIARGTKFCIGTVLCTLAASIGSGWDRNTSRLTGLDIAGHRSFAGMPPMTGNHSPFMLLAIGTEMKKEMLSPSHGTFVTSTVVFALTLVWIIQDRQEDRLQDHFLLGGSFVGAALGLVVGFDTQGIMLSMMPGAVLAAVVISVISHELCGGKILSKNVDCGNGCWFELPIDVGKHLCEIREEAENKRSEEEEEDDDDASKAVDDKANKGEDGEAQEEGEEDDDHDESRLRILDQGVQEQRPSLETSSHTFCRNGSWHVKAIDTKANKGEDNKAKEEEEEDSNQAINNNGNKYEDGKDEDGKDKGDEDKDEDEDDHDHDRSS